MESSRSHGLNLLAVAFEQMNDCLVVLDEVGQILDVNPFMLSLLGYERDEVVGRSVADFLDPGELDRAIRVMSMVAADTLEVPVSPALYRLRCRDGRWLPIELNATAVSPAPPGREPEPREQTAGAAAGPDDGNAGSGPVVVVIGRYSADRDLQDRIMSRLVSGESPTSIIELVPEFGHWRHPLDHFGVVCNDDRGTPVVFGSDVLVELARLDDTDTPWTRVAASGLELVVARDDLAPPLRAAAIERGLGSCWAVPVADPLFERGAAIVVWCRDQGPDVEVHRYAVETMARSLAVILQWRHQVTRLLQAARRDPLTGLTNRTGFWEVLDALAREKAAPLVAVLYVDLDGFKAVNDAHGHRSGDLVLTEAAQRIASVIRPGDTVARLGGDEFAIVCRDLTTEGESIAIAERVLAAIRAPFSVEDEQVELGASVGIAAVLGYDLRPDELLDSADQALYQAKNAGRGGWHLASSDDGPAGTLAT